MFCIVCYTHLACHSSAQSTKGSTTDWHNLTLSCAPTHIAVTVVFHAIVCTPGTVPVWPTEMAAQQCVKMQMTVIPLISVRMGCQQ